MFDVMRSTGLVALSAACLSLLPHLAHAEEVRSYKSFNYPDRYIRHRNFLAYIEPGDDELSRADATFKTVPGLAGRCASFESYNKPGYYLRHQNYRLKIGKFTNTALFRADATFCRSKGLADPAGTSFESVNYPNHYIRHVDFELRIDPNNGSDQFKQDATFFPIPPRDKDASSGDTNAID